MKYASDLLVKARLLVRLERTRPKEAALRRAVSPAYYAVFHLLTEEAARHLVGNQNRTLHRQTQVVKSDITPEMVGMILPPIC